MWHAGFCSVRISLPPFFPSGVPVYAYTMLYAPNLFAYAFCGSRFLSFTLFPPPPYFRCCPPRSPCPFLFMLTRRAWLSKFLLGPSSSLALFFFPFPPRSSDIGLGVAEVLVVCWGPVTIPSTEHRSFPCPCFLFYFLFNSPVALPPPLSAAWAISSRSVHFCFSSLLFPCFLPPTALIPLLALSRSVFVPSLRM